MIKALLSLKPSIKIKLHNCLSSIFDFSPTQSIVLTGVYDEIDRCVYFQPFKAKSTYALEKSERDSLKA
jgi:hypothetical protein